MWFFVHCIKLYEIQMCHVKLFWFSSSPTIIDKANFQRQIWEKVEELIRIKFCAKNSLHIGWKFVQLFFLKHSFTEGVAALTTDPCARPWKLNIKVFMYNTSPGTSVKYVWGNIIFRFTAHDTFCFINSSLLIKGHLEVWTAREETLN